MASSKRTLDKAVRYFRNVALPDVVMGADLIDVFRRHEEFNKSLGEFFTSQRAILISHIEEVESEQSLEIESPKHFASLELRIWKHFKSQADFILPYVEFTRLFMERLERMFVGEPHQGRP